MIEQVLEAYSDLEIPRREGFRGKFPHGGQIDAVCCPHDEEQQETQALQHGKEDDERHPCDGPARLLDATYGKLDALAKDKEEQDEHPPQSVEHIGGDVDRFDVARCVHGRICDLPLLRLVTGVPRSPEEDPDRGEDGGPHHDAQDAGHAE